MRKVLRFVTMWRSPRSLVVLRITGQHRPNSAISPRNWSAHREKRVALSISKVALRASGAVYHFGAVEKLPPARFHCPLMYAAIPCARKTPPSK